MRKPQHDPGCELGTVVTMVLTGWLCDSPLGWPSVFYVCGGVGLAWGVVWFRFMAGKGDHDRSGKGEARKVIFIKFFVD